MESLSKLYDKITDLFGKIRWIIPILVVLSLLLLVFFPSLISQDFVSLIVILGFPIAYMSFIFYGEDHKKSTNLYSQIKTVYDNSPKINTNTETIIAEKSGLVASQNKLADQIQSLNDSIPVSEFANVHSKIEIIYKNIPQIDQDVQQILTQISHLNESQKALADQIQSLKANIPAAEPSEPHNNDGLAGRKKVRTPKEYIRASFAGRCHK